MEDIFAFESGVTSHGLRVFVRHCELPRPQVIAGLSVFSGFRQFRRESPGLSHALEHALADAEGAMPRILGKQRFAREHRLIIESLGSTDAEMASWRLRATPERLNDMLCFLNGVTRVAPTEFSLSGLKEVLNREFAEERNPDQEKIDTVLCQPLVGVDHPHLAGFQETPETIALLTKEQLLAHWRRYYTLANMTLVVAGSTTLADTIAAAEIAFSEMPHDAGAVRDPVQSIRAQQVRSGEFVVALRDVLGDTHCLRRDSRIRLLRATTPRALHYQQSIFVTQVISAVCFRALREERKIIYGVGGGATPYRDLDLYEIEVVFETGRYEECASSLRHLPDLVKDRGREEFEMEKCEAMTRLALSDHTLRQMHVSAMREAAIFDYIQTYTELMRVLEETTFDDVVRCVEELFAPDKSLMVTIVP